MKGITIGMETKNDSLKSFCRIHDDGLYVGSCDYGEYELELNGIHDVLIVGGSWLVPELLLKNMDKFKWRCLTLEDSVDANLLGVLSNALSFLFRCKKQNKNVLVHCVAGVSRSVSVCIAFLLATHCVDSPESGLHMIQSLWPRASPNVGFMKQLDTFSKMNSPKQFSLNFHLPAHRPWTIDEQIHRLVLLRRWRRCAKTPCNVPTRLLIPHSKTTTMKSTDSIDALYTRCRLCRFLLTNSRYHLNMSQCSLKVKGVVHILPVDFMNETIASLNQSSGKLFCPNCRAHVGNYDWNSHELYNLRSFDFESLPTFAMVRKSIDVVQ
mmetsp:Transcript_2689/g.4737  ORF Transcript_2689/g.4737 Transcript_2689/m.4737 type:complete len:324 (-) Transcript_2689:1316-2287(-)